MIAVETLVMLRGRQPRHGFEVTVHDPEAGEWSLTIDGGEPISIAGVTAGAVVTITETGAEPPREPDPRLPFRHSYASVDPKTVRLFAPGRSWGMTRAGAR